MLDPRKVTLSRTAFVGRMILVDVGNTYVYENGKRTDVVAGVRCSVVLDGYDYERMVVKLPAGTAVDSALVGKPVDFTGFAARVYSFQGKIGYTATANAVVAAKA